MLVGLGKEMATTYEEYASKGLTPTLHSIAYLCGRLLLPRKCSSGREAIPLLHRIIHTAASDASGSTQPTNTGGPGSAAAAAAACRITDASAAPGTRIMLHCPRLSASAASIGSGELQLIIDGGRGAVDVCMK